MRKGSVGAAPRAVVALASVILVFSSTAHAQVTLKYKFPEGQKQNYELTETVSQVLKLAGQAFPTEQKQIVSLSWTFGKKQGESTQPIAQKIESLEMELSAPGGIKISYDSDDPNAKIARPEMSFLGDVYKIVSHLDYTVMLGADNKVETVEGTDKILQKAEKLDEKAKQAIRDAVDSERIKRDFEEHYGSFPDRSVRPGESWERTDKHPLGNAQTLTFQKRYEYAGNEKRGDATLDRINVKTSEVKYAMDPKSPSPLKVLKSDLKVIAGDGFILFDREAGRVVVSKEKMQIKGPMTFKSGDQEIEGELDWTLDTEMELQPETK
jgi:hypothetical protein